MTHMTSSESMRIWVGGILFRWIVTSGNFDSRSSTLDGPLEGPPLEERREREDLQIGELLSSEASNDKVFPLIDGCALVEVYLQGV